MHAGRRADLSGGNSGAKLDAGIDREADDVVRMVQVKSLRPPYNSPETGQYTVMQSKENGRVAVMPCRYTLLQSTGSAQRTWVQSLGSSTMPAPAAWYTTRPGWSQARIEEEISRDARHV